MPMGCKNGPIYFQKWMSKLLQQLPQQYHDKIGSVIDDIVISSDSLDECILMQ